MQPDAVLLADRAELGERVDRGRRRRPDRRADEHRGVAAGDVALEPGGECRGPHGEVAVDLHDADGVGAESGDPDGLLHRGVGLRRDVDGGPVGVDAVPEGRRPVLDRCSAASRATRLAPELESWTTPPPVPVDRKDAGRPSRSASQSMTCCSSSVAAGLVTHDMPWTPSPAETRSPSTEGPRCWPGSSRRSRGAASA